jgi:transcriptional regulator with XRE-family HTH domain
MKSRPLFSKQLELLRGDAPASAVARHCQITRQYVRQVEKGQRSPSNEVLLRWLDYFKFTPSDRPDIIRSVNTYREQVNAYVREYAELEQEVLANNGNVLEEFMSEIAHIISEGGYLKQDFVENRIYLIRKSYERHHKS